MAERLAAGVRATWPDMPLPIRRWAASMLGSRIADVEEQTGGMSPGCASRLVGDDGSRLFVKVVGRIHNPDTPTLFRREVTALDLIGSADLWADLVAVWDDDDWVAILLEDVEGRHPDLTHDPDLGAVLSATDALADELAHRVPEPPEPQPGGGLGDLHRAFVRWGASVDRLAEIDPAFVPAWLPGRADEVRERVTTLTEQTERHLVHADIRADNLLIRPAGTPVFLDWGMAAVGPAWVDPLMARLGLVESRAFDDAVASCLRLAEAGEEIVTAFLLGLGVFLAWRATSAIDVNLPTINAFRIAESRRCLTGAGRRLGIDLGGISSRW
ncbi:MAG: phosphotransferase [Nocardioidaceae bacterium]|nr:phosphotransferase [Nocardioidaceae bacterium]